MASVNTNSGAVGSWTQLSSTLPSTLVGPAAVLYNGYIYVVGGLLTSGSPSPYVYSAAVHADGTLGSWTTSANNYPTGIAFATAFAYGARLYVLNGDKDSMTAPNETGTTSSGVDTVNFASALNGSVGTWTSATSTVKNRQKHITWNAFGQLISAEGVYNGGPGAQEMEQSAIQANGTLAAWAGIVAGNSPGANVYNAAAIVSPLASSALTPRLLLLGGQLYTALTSGVPSANVYYNTAP